MSYLKMSFRKEIKGVKVEEKKSFPGNILSQKLLKIVKRNPVCEYLLGQSVLCIHKLFASVPRFVSFSF